MAVGFHAWLLIDNKTSTEELLAKAAAEKAEYRSFIVLFV
jgi:hypothetical protein